MAIVIGLLIPLVWLTLAIVKLFFWIPIQNFEQIFSWPPLLWIIGLAVLSSLLSNHESR